MKTTTISHALFALSLTSTLALGGCGRLGTSSSGDGDVAADSADTADLTSALTATTTDGVDVSVASSATIATNAEAKAKSFFQPSGCLTTQVSGTQVTYSFNGCTGPYGLVNLKGTVSGTYVATGTGTATVTLKGTNLTANSTTLGLDATVTLTNSGGSRSATVNSKTTATTQRGRSVEHSGSYVTTWDGSCITLSGSFSTRVGLVAWSTAIANYKRCQSSCPQSGTVAITAGMETYTIAFSGGTTAQLSSTKGDTATVPLYCGK